MPGLVPGIHVFPVNIPAQDVDARHVRRDNARSLSSGRALRGPVGAFCPAMTRSRKLDVRHDWNQTVISGANPIPQGAVPTRRGGPRADVDLPTPRAGTFARAGCDSAGSGKALPSDLIRGCAAVFRKDHTQL